MAKLISQTVTLTFSKIIKDSEDEHKVSLANNETIAALEQVAQELAGDGILVEAEKK